MVFVYFLLLLAFFSSWGRKEKVSKNMWVLAFLAWAFSVALLIYHGSTPFEVQL